MENKSTIQQIAKANDFYLKGKLKPAYMEIKKALKKSPKNAEAFHTLSLIEYSQGKIDLAITHINEALKLKTSNAEWYKNLAIMHCNQRRFKESSQAALEAIKLQEDYSDAYQVLGESLYFLNDYANAITAFAKVLQQNSNDVDAYIGIAKSLDKTGETDQAINALLNAIQLDDKNPNIYGDLAAYYFSVGLVDESLTCLKKLVALTPGSAANHSALITTLTYRFDFNDQVMADYLLYSARHCLPLAKKIKPFNNEVTTNKKIKIGYVSADLYNHSLAFYIEPVLAHHDKQKFEIYCYYNNDVIDNYTRKIRMHCNHWRQVQDMDDDKLAEQIRQDGIDILIDLSGHTVGNRLLVFSRKPAPVQITWLGFPTTTGLTAMDYIFLNKGTVSKEAEQFFTEQVVLLDKIASFSPPKNAPNINVLPALSKDQVTFASFNAPFKVTDEMIAVWCGIMKKVTNSRLILYIGKGKNELVKKIFLDKFSANGIDPARLELHPSIPLNQYLAAHHEVDLCLDTFPYNGSTTTFMSLWMGVPVVSLAGASPQSNQAAIILKIIGLNQFIANTVDEYIDIACHYADNLTELQAIRASTRELIEHSELMNNDMITLDIENAYIAAWKKWVSSQGLN